jgi:hypothetical protein
MRILTQAPERRPGSYRLSRRLAITPSKPCFLTAATISAALLAFLVNGCALYPSQPQGQIEVQAVSWPLVKKYAEHDAGLPGQKVVVQRAADQSVVDEKTTDASGILVFNVPAGKYLVLGVGEQSEAVTVESGQVVKLKLVVH